MRNDSAHFKGGITKFNPSPFPGICWSCTGPSFFQNAPVLPESRHFQVIREWCPRTIFTSVSPEGYDPRVVGNTNRKRKYTVRGLNHQLKKLCRHNREGSFGTQVQRERELTLIANQLHDIGYRGMNSHSLKPKHVEALVGNWLKNEVATGTIKNRMSAFRWWARKVNRQNVVARSNVHYGIPNRVFITNTSKAKSVLEADLAKVRDQHVRMSLELQQAFGLRREEAIKFIPTYADKGDHIVLKPSWTKGGKARGIPITSVDQREVLDRAHKLAGKGSLIPSSRNYVQQLRIYEGHTIRAGLSKMHGLRHSYAQRRYEELTGWKSPAAGGPPSKSLNRKQREQDHQARLVISRELGHERRQVVSVYLGT